MRTDSVTFWSWMASIGFHLVILVAFGAWKLSEGHQTPAARDVPSAAIATVARLTAAAPITPKPKVKSLSHAPTPAHVHADLDIYSFFASESRDSHPKTPILRNADSSGSIFAKAPALPARSVEFFGSPTDQRKICYVVDSSGSMYGVFGQVRRKLKDSIADLRPNQYFYIIFFGGEKLFESGQGSLVRATEKAKADACEFIDSMNPAGVTNAAAALARALQVRDPAGDKPSLVYFLTDGFELTSQRANAFAQAIIDMFRNESPSTIINTIGFWPQPADRTMLESIAHGTGGQAVFVTEDIR